MFICIDTSQCAGTGKTLDEAYQDYTQYHGSDEVAECTFYEKAEPLEIEVLIVPKQTITKSRG